jgi:class 3 adenylate cyclase
VTESLPEPGRRTLLVTVVFVDIVEYSTRVVAQQIEQKTRLNEMIGRAIEAVPVAERMTVDTGDGAALCFLGDPEDALIAASNLRAAAGSALALRLGINLGPVKIVKDVNGRPNIIGDGINDAQRVMSFAQPNQILVSRSYYEVLSRLSYEYSRLFAYAGLHRDKHVREHEVYEVTTGEPGTVVPAPPPAVARPKEMVVDTEFVPPPSPGPASARFDAAVLGRLEAALAHCIGPLARVILRKAAGAATDLPQLYRTLAASVPESKHVEFARQVGDLTGHLAAPPDPVVPSAGAPAPAGAPQLLSAEVLATATERLAVYIGPVAKVMVKKAAEQATSARDLYQRLAPHIDDPRDRERFLALTPDGRLTPGSS